MTIASRNPTNLTVTALDIMIQYRSADTPGKDAKQGDFRFFALSHWSPGLLEAFSMSCATRTSPSVQEGLSRLLGGSAVARTFSNHQLVRLHDL